MPKYKWIDSILLTILLICLYILEKEVGMLICIAGILLFTSMILKVWGAFDIRLNYFTKNFNYQKTNEQVIALTFDDGPTEYTLDILAFLKEQEIKATFFCIGKQVDLYPEILKQIYSQGHEIGNHTYHHDQKNGFFDKHRIAYEIKRCDAIIIQTIGYRPTIFRPPFGVTNPNIAKALRVTNHEVIGWNIRSLDTVTKDVQIIANRVMKKLKPGGIILLHDTSEKTLQVLKIIIPEIKRLNYTFATISQLKNK